MTNISLKFQDNASGPGGPNRLGAAVRSVGKSPFQTADRLQAILRLSTSDFQYGRYRILLYRFLTDNVPIINACVWTWARLSAAPGSFRVAEGTDERLKEKAERRLAELSQRLYRTPTGHPVWLVTLLTELFSGLYRDGVFAGFVTVLKDGSGIDQFVSVDVANLRYETDHGQPRLVLDHDKGSLDLGRGDFYYIPFNGSLTEPLGRSILKAVPFVSFVEQQLVDDMRRSSHNSGYHRLHVKITPPERTAGESDSAYIDRINGYFDATVSMIKSCEVDDNPVT
ncbi:MAG TPA: hypothetical protein VN285_00615 [Candidatus Deferrimicrobium sp.]|nr:hypothetical protein [Candidatus Deferrimicrobium sp.]